MMKNRRGVNLSKLIYLGYYSLDRNERKVSPAGNTMMNYVINVLKRIDNNLEVISPAQSDKNCPKEIIKENDVQYIFLPSYKNDNILLKIINRWRRNSDLYKELSDSLCDGDTLIVYHSLAYIHILKKIRKKKKINLVLQVCEIYGDVLASNNKKKNEIKWIKSADKFIFSTERLEEILNTEKKDFTICMGMYKYDNTNYFKCFEDNLIHVVYAGTFDQRKGGGIAAETAKYLDDRYHVHIMGFGSKEQILEMKKLVDDIGKVSKCKLTYDGLKIGDDYNNFIKSCDIGLSTQNPEASFNETSFPSKILSYLSNGLRVVSIKIPVIEKSKISNSLFFYEHQTPEEIAMTIKLINFDDIYDSKQILDNLDNDFYGDMKNMLK